MSVDVKVPVLAESVAEATLMKWQKKVGDAVNRGDSLIDIETDKVTLEVSAPDSGVLAEIIKKDGDEVKSDEVIARIDTSASVPAAAAEKTAAPEQKTLPEMESKSTKESPKTSPAVRNLLHENNLTAKDISIPDGADRITKEDVLKHIGNLKESPATTTVADKTEAKAPQTPVPVINTGARPEQSVPMTRLRKRAAERLLGAQHDNAILTTFNEVNMHAVMELRSRYKDEFEKVHGIKLGFMSFFTRAAVEALKKFPVINASVDGDNIVYHGYFDIGIAVSSPRGLVVPIIRDADTLSLAGIEAKIREYGEKARDSKLALEELTGGTFTITNGGVFGSMLSTPIINPPQSAILGMHKTQDRPVAENGNVVIRPVMYLALSYDHRIIDGREAVQFLVTIKQLLEDPARLLLEI